MRPFCHTLFIMHMHHSKSAKPLSKENQSKALALLHCTALPITHSFASHQRVNILILALHDTALRKLLQSQRHKHACIVTPGV